MKEKKRMEKDFNEIRKANFVVKTQRKDFADELPLTYMD